MRNPARLALAVIVVMAGLLVLPRSASRFIAPDASAQVPTPLISDLLGRPSPSNSPSEDPDPGGGGEDPPDGEGGGGGGGGQGGNRPGEDDGKRGKKGDDGNRKGDKGKGKNGRGPDGKKGKKGKKNKVVEPLPSIAGRIPGAYGTERLVAAAIRLRSLGMSQETVISKVYPPFIIAGNASWVDTWHAPRYGPAPGQVRVHEGQDIFCDYGDPVLAPEAGTLDTSNGGLGGLTARVHRADGRYWYMTHLAALNKEFSEGDYVQPGDILGYCGNSGNAETTPPHVHFGFYGPEGVKPRNPMKHLIAWLRAAELRVVDVLARIEGKRQDEYQAGAITAARRFGDSFVPGRAELTFAGESLWASGSSPASGAFGLAEAALLEALSTNGLELGILPVPVDLQLAPQAGPARLDEDSELARLLEAASHGHSHPEGAD